MLRATNLHKQYKGREVVSGVSLKVKQGEVVGLLGPNGAGKTTCFHMIVGLVPVDQGQITIDGQDLTRKPVNLRAKQGIGYLPQDASIFRKLSVQNNILAILEMRSDLDKKMRRVELEHLMEELSVNHLADQTGISLSGGERRRVEIARALAANPRFMLLDEPFAGVDPISVSDIKNIVTHLVSRDIGVLITDHNVRETLDICDYAYILSDGKELAAGSSEEVLNNQSVRDVYLGDSFRI
ncbi:MAG: LPS export ABC transporter ATP-binding protein [Xanthomonadales bacterium]|nr:LPS export ABC transporter ATP-binding protein [Xanthomonadales bacterium]